MERTKNKMTNEEYLVLDELYFTTPFTKLQERVEWEEKKLVDLLISLLEKGWVKGVNIETEQDITDPDLIRNQFNALHFLATKKGLLAHNTL
jgi:hypothetical protein